MGIFGSESKEDKLYEALEDFEIHITDATNQTGSAVIDFSAYVVMF